MRSLRLALVLCSLLTACKQSTSSPEGAPSGGTQQPAATAPSGDAIRIGEARALSEEIADERAAMAAMARLHSEYRMVSELRHVSIPLRSSLGARTPHAPEHANGGPVFPGPPLANTLILPFR